MIRLKKWEHLREQMAKLGIFEDDFEEKFIIGSGRGGQKLQKTASCVFLMHVPSGISVKCQQARSREVNRYYARLRICEKYQERVLQEKTARQKEIEKIRRQKKRRSRRTKEKILAEKHHRSDIKEQRKKPKHDDE